MDSRGARLVPRSVGHDATAYGECNHKPPVNPVMSRAYAGNATGVNERRPERGRSDRWRVQERRLTVSHALRRSYAPLLYGSNPPLGLAATGLPCEGAALRILVTDVAGGEGGATAVGGSSSLPSSRPPNNLANHINASRKSVSRIYLLCAGAYMSQRARSPRNAGNVKCITQTEQQVCVSDFLSPSLSPCLREARPAAGPASENVAASQQPVRAPHRLGRQRHA